MPDPEDSITRFTKRVTNYVRFRPGYPSAVVDLLAREARLTKQSQIADVGSGTGLLSRAFVERGYAVTGVEPNREMREAGDALLAEYTGFRSVAARAEATTLPDHSIDLAVAGQAFHWFSLLEARLEWTRILKPGGIAALIWNERHIASPFMHETEELIDRYAAKLDPDGAIREAGRSRIDSFFAPLRCRLSEFDNAQEFGFEGLVGRIASCSFLPGECDPLYKPMAASLAEIFSRYQRDGLVHFEYRTKVYWGRLVAAD